MFDAAKRHGSFRERHALDARHFTIGGEQQIQLAFERNLERILDVWILPGVLIRFDRNHFDIMALRERRCFRDGDGFGGAGCDSLSRQAVG